MLDMSPLNCNASSYISVISVIIKTTFLESMKSAEVGELWFLGLQHPALKCTLLTDHPKKASNICTALKNLVLRNYSGKRHKEK